MFNPSLGVIVIDCFNAQLAVDVMAAVGEYDDETAAVVLTCWAYEAEGELVRN